MKNQVLFSLLFCFSLALTSLAQPWNADELVASQTAEPQQQSIFTTMQYQDVLDIDLITDLNLLVEQKKTDQYQEAAIHFTSVDGTRIQQQAKVKARGKSRRRICDFPPIKIKFKKDALEAVGMHKEFNEYKLVTHCLENEDAEQNLLKEFLAYKVYNELTDFSFRVQLVRIKYIDSQTGEPAFTKYGFLLEDNEELCHRLEGEMLKSYNLPVESLQAEQFNLLALFQYMIGNTDWDISVRHNVKIIKSEGQAEPIIVPYDFDFSGLVNTHYARPNSTLPQLDVRDRVYQGSCMDDATLENLTSSLKGKKEQIMEIIKDFPQLDKKERKDIIKFLNSFFASLDKPAELKEKFHWNCPVTE